MGIGGRILTWFEGEWREGNTMIMGAADHATWLGSMVFDGARAFEGVMPDLDLHSQRIIRSAKSMGYDAPVDADVIEGLIREVRTRPRVLMRFTSRNWRCPRAVNTRLGFRLFVARVRTWH